MRAEDPVDGTDVAGAEVLRAVPEAVQGGAEAHDEALLYGAFAAVDGSQERGSEEFV